MPETPPSQPPTLLAVAVLYNCNVSQSQSVSSLLEILSEHPALAGAFRLLIYDNSPQPQNLATGAAFKVEYMHDPENGGLARAYNVALARAEAEGQPWLLLLDQDTSLTHAFLVELVAAVSTLAAQREVAAIVPKLLVNGEIHSPAANFIRSLRRQLLRPPAGMREDVVGTQPQHLCSYNSGTTLRVSAVRSIGGFPAEFWLDFLDHAVFHALYIAGYRTYVLRAVLRHDFSHSEIESVPQWRLRNVLLARTLYVIRRGNLLDRLLYRFWLLRHARRLRQTHNDAQVWKQTARQALLLSVPKDRQR